MAPQMLEYSDLERSEEIGHIWWTWALVSSDQTSGNRLPREIVWRYTQFSSQEQCLIISFKIPS